MQPAESIISSVNHAWGNTAQQSINTSQHRQLDAVAPELYAEEGVAGRSDQGEELPWVMVTLKVDLPQVTNKGEVRTSMPVA